MKISTALPQSYWTRLNEFKEGEEALNKFKRFGKKKKPKKRKSCNRSFQSLSTELQILNPFSSELQSLLQEYAIDGEITGESVKKLLQNLGLLHSFPGRKVVRCGSNIIAKCSPMQDLSHELAAL